MDAEIRKKIEEMKVKLKEDINSLCKENVTTERLIEVLEVYFDTDNSKLIYKIMAKSNPAVHKIDVSFSID